MAHVQKVACLLGPGFEDAEFRAPYEALVGAGYRVEIIGAAAGQVLAGRRGKEELRADVGVDEASPESYDGLLIPGGESPDRLRADERFLDFTRRYDALGRPLVTIGHGPQLLLTAGLLTPERRLTAWRTVQRDLERAGAHVLDAPVVRDRHLLTGRQSSDLQAFTRAMLDLLDTALAAGKSSSSEAW